MNHFVTFSNGQKAIVTNQVFARIGSVALQLKDPPTQSDREDQLGYYHDDNDDDFVRAAHCIQRRPLKIVKLINYHGLE